MVNNSVVSFYDNFGLIFNGSKHKATTGIENKKPKEQSVSFVLSSYHNTNHCNLASWIYLYTLRARIFLANVRGNRCIVQSDMTELN